MYNEILTKYDALVAKCDRFERKGKSMPYTSANGHMFSLLNKDGQLGIRFSKQRQKEYLEKFNSDFLKSHGATMQGYILVTDEMWKDEALLLELLNESFDYVQSLPSK